MSMCAPLLFLVLTHFVYLELIDKETLTKYLLELIDGKLEKDQPHLWAILAGMVMDLYLYELIPGLEEHLNKGYVDPDYTSLADLRRLVCYL